MLCFACHPIRGISVSRLCTGKCIPSLISSVQAEPSSVAEIQRRYGDHLYAKHDYDAAMTQYVATIGHMEPSYVIRKFLDAQRIHNLTSYLEELHTQVSCLGSVSPLAGSILGFLGIHTLSLHLTFAYLTMLAEETQVCI